MKEFRYEWVWRKNTITGQLNANRTPLKCHENIMIFCDKAPPYNPQVTHTAPKVIKDSPVNSSNYGRCEKRDGVRMVDYTYPWDVIDFDVNKDEKIHPTQKPVALCEYLIKTYTDEGMTVLDNCMGSGTTGVAAVQTGRNFIGIEKDENYYAKAVERISNAEYKVRNRTTLDSFMGGTA